MKYNFENKFVGRALIITALYVLGAAFNEVLTGIALLMTLYEILRSDTEHIFKLELILVPLGGIMYIGGSFSLFNIIQFATVLVLIMRKVHNISKQVVGFVLLILLLSAYGIIITGMGNLVDEISFIFEMAVLALILDDIDELDFDGSIRAFSLGLTLSSVSYLFVDYLPGITKYVSNAKYRISGSTEKVDRFSGLAGNPNHYTMAISIAIAGLLVIVICRRMKKRDFIYLGSLIVFGIMSLSKSFFLGLLFTIGVIIAYMLIRTPGRAIRWTAFVFALFVIVMTVGNFKYLDIILDRVLVNRGAVDLNTYTSNRLDHYQVYIDAICGSLRIFLFGNGYGTLINGVASHNVYLEALYYFGIVGISAYLYMIKLIYQSSRNNGQGFLRFMILFVIIFRGLAINMFTSIMFPYYVLIALLMMKSDCSIKLKLSQGG